MLATGCYDRDMTNLETLRRLIQTSPQMMFPQEDRANLEKLASEMGFAIITRSDVTVNQGGGQKHPLTISFRL